MYTFGLPLSSCLLSVVLLLLDLAPCGNAAATVKFTIVSEARTPGKRTDSECRCFPGDACWPTESDWKALNQSVNGQLVATVPIGSVCHGDETYEAKECANLKEAWHVPETHCETSGSVLTPFFANQSCDPFLPRHSQCVIGTYIQYAVDVSQISDVQSALEFAKEKNLRFVIRNTGHDYFGKSTGAGGLGVWTHHLKSFEVLDYRSSFYTGKAVEMGAGMQAGEAAELAFKQGLTLVAGVCPSVGLAGGYTQGGGLGPLTSRYGFGADQVLEWQVILADGSVVTATPDSHTDLYWALSGGGGSSYGVVYSMTVKAHRNEMTTAANLSFANAESEDSFFDAVEAFHSVVPALSDTGATALWTVQSNGFSLGPVTGPGITKEKVDSILQPAIQKLEDLEMPYSYSSAKFPSYYESYLAYNPPSNSPGLQIGGRLVPRSVFTDNGDGFIQAIRDIVGYGAAVTGVSYREPADPSFPNSVNPELRNSMVSFQVGMLWNDTNWDLNIENQELITDTLVPSLAKLIPGGGSAYLNQADFREPEWQQVFYGENYQTLVDTKTEYDPDGVFWGRTAVGSEKWAETEDKRLCRVS